MKSIAVLAGVEKISVALALKAISGMVSSDSRFKLALPGLVESDPDLRQAAWFADTKVKFLEFCNQKHVNPVGCSSLSVTGPYSGDDRQDNEYEISMGEFELFSRSLGLDVLSQVKNEVVVDTIVGVSHDTKIQVPNENAPSLLRKVILSPEIKPSGLNGAKTLRSRLKVRNPQAVAGGSDDDFYDPEIDENILDRKNAQQAKKEKVLKKSPPGTLSKLRIRKLAVRLAWRIEVDTKQPAKTVEVMTALCKLADSTDKPKWLLKQVIDVKKQSAVYWTTTTEINKQFRRADCQDALKKWRDSYLKK